MPWRLYHLLPDWSATFRDIFLSILVENLQDISDQLWSVQFLLTHEVRHGGRPRLLSSLGRQDIPLCLCCTNFLLVFLFSLEPSELQVGGWRHFFWGDHDSSLVKASGRAMLALRIGGFSRYSRALVEDVDHNPLLVVFVLSGNPSENLQVFVSHRVPQLMQMMITVEDCPPGEASWSATLLGSSQLQPKASWAQCCVCFSLSRGCLNLTFHEKSPDFKCQLLFKQKIFYCMNSTEPKLGSLGLGLPRNSLLVFTVENAVFAPTSSPLCTSPGDSHIPPWTLHSAPLH